MKICSIYGCDRSAEARGWCIMHYKRWWRYRDPTFKAPRRSTLMEWIEAHLNFDGPKCLIWPFNRDRRNGRALMTVNRSTVNPARVVCELINGPPPTLKHETAHSCGRGDAGCVHPCHIRWATHAENEADKKIHGTSPEGVRHGMAKLSEADVLAIRNSRESSSVVGEQYGVSSSMICRIRRRVNWKHL